MLYSMKTDKGIVRSNNQDNCYVSVFDEHSCFAIVCDGMGGVKAGEVASEIAIKEVSAIFIDGWKNDFEIEDAKKLLLKAIKTANLKILGLASSDAKYQGMGTTIVAAVIIGDKLLIANVGDSRAYFVGKELKQITKDHSLVQELVDSGELTSEQAEKYPHKNYITRALGIGSHIEVDFFCENIGDENILLCSDGLYNFVSRDEIYGIITASADAFENISVKLIDEANKNGGGDNVTAVIIKK